MPVLGKGNHLYSNFLCRAHGIAAVGTIFDSFIMTRYRAEIRSPSRRRSDALRVTPQSWVILLCDTRPEAVLSRDRKSVVCTPEVSWCPLPEPNLVAFKYMCQDRGLIIILDF